MCCRYIYIYTHTFAYAYAYAYSYIYIYIMAGSYDINLKGHVQTPGLLHSSEASR